MRALPNLGLDPEREALAQELFGLNRQVHDRAIALVDPIPAPPELTMQQIRVLGLVAKSPGITGHELCVALGISAPTASGLVERLVEKELVRRSDDQTDRRVRRLHLTEQGQQVVLDMDSMQGRVLGLILGLLSADDLRLLCTSTRIVLTALESAETSAIEGAGSSSADH